MEPRRGFLLGLVRVMSGARYVRYDHSFCTVTSPNLPLYISSLQSDAKSSAGNGMDTPLFGDA